VGWIQIRISVVVSMLARIHRQGQGKKKKGQNFIITSHSKQQSKMIAIMKDWNYYYYYCCDKASWKPSLKPSRLCGIRREKTRPSWNNSRSRHHTAAIVAHVSIPVCTIG